MVAILDQGNPKLVGAPCGKVEGEIPLDRFEKKPHGVGLNGVDEQAQSRKQLVERWMDLV